jgi:hypothetical protein
MSQSNDLNGYSMLSTSGKSDAFWRCSLNAYVWPIILANTEPKGLFSPEKKNFVFSERDLAISS